jgi:hypothetical protein
MEGIDGLLLTPRRLFSTLEECHASWTWPQPRDNMKVPGSHWPRAVPATGQLTLAPAHGNKGGREAKQAAPHQKRGAGETVGRKGHINRPSLRPTPSWHMAKAFERIGR